MAEPQPNVMLTWLRGLANLVSPRSASAEVIPADKGTWTLTGEDAERFRQLVGQMIQQATTQPEDAKTQGIPTRQSDEHTSNTPATVEQADDEQLPVEIQNVQALQAIEKRMRALLTDSGENALGNDALAHLLQRYAQHQDKYFDALSTYEARYPEEFGHDQEAATDLHNLREAQQGTP